MKHRNPHAVAAHHRKAGPHLTRDDVPHDDGPQGLSREEWIASIVDRLEAGRAEYGDASFDKPQHELVRELTEEAADLAGWGFVMWAQTVGFDRGDTLRQAPEYLRAASHASVLPPTSSDPRSLSVWLGAVSLWLMRRLDRSGQ